MAINQGRKILKANLSKSSCLQEKKNCKPAYVWLLEMNTNQLQLMEENFLFSKEKRDKRGEDWKRLSYEMKKETDQRKKNTLKKKVLGL